MSAVMKASSTRSVVERHLRCFAQLDLDGILSDYAPDAILLTANGPLQGVDGIRSLLAPMIAEFAKPGATFELSRQLVVGEYGYIVWSARTADQVYELATDTFLVRDGRIHMQSFAARTVPLIPGER